ncbi:MAG: hypothetical protein L3J52_06400 [Proteobacteria bacterium]|nr:hypothetical protein [Pseudomonadota bacterium]
MKTYILTLAVFAFSLSAYAVNYKDLDALGVSEKVQQQLLDSIELRRSLNERQKAGVGTLGAFVTVGVQNSCDYFVGTTPIQDAIDAGETEIRIANDMTHIENLTINDKGIVLKGGYVDCAAAASDIQTGSTAIRGVTAAGFPVISILGDTERHTIVLDSLALSLGSGTGFFPGGGISTIGADAQISIVNSIITGNTSAFGGGIAILAGDTDINLIDTLIVLNTAGYAGGIYCGGSDASILLLGSSGVSGNTADGSVGAADVAGKGGGLFITDQCGFTSFSGTAGGLFDFRGIAANTATDQGGGIFAKDGATVSLWGAQVCVFLFCFGDDTNPANLNGNQAESDGGVGHTSVRGGAGAFITGADTSLTIYHGKVTDNTLGDITIDGGGIYVDAGATFTTGRLGKACWSQDNCNYYANNASGSAIGYGGAFFNRGSTMNITNTVIENNRADFGTVLFTTGAEAITTIKGSLIHHNGNGGADGFSDNRVFRVTGGAKLDIHHSTIADNNASIAVFDINLDATSIIYSSIVHDASSGNVHDSNLGFVSHDCTIFHEDASIPGGLGPTSVVADPEFVDRGNNDFHIDAALSPAVDFCDDDMTDVDYRDMDYEEFGFDDPTVANGLGGFDVGADETYGNDIIFKNGFE